MLAAFAGNGMYRINLDLAGRSSGYCSYTRIVALQQKEWGMQVFKVEGMSCQHCVAAITRALQMLDTAAVVEVDLEQGLVRVSSLAAEAQLIHALTEEGYPAAAIPE
jgi:copper chaperone